eukprot:TRINITY_DN20076_c0_g1_i1.p2 TRINITY_DN20076_c0_g1~~TRINITY_DN20076_c0_g1_i1.p2  ORF type:complete len:207 (+),score=68.75 TRINITY_DN20076_c0_g1_i1:75-623(+)
MLASMGRAALARQSARAASGLGQRAPCRKAARFASQATFAPSYAVTLSGAKSALAAAEEHATKSGWNVTIAVVDIGGHVTALHRMDGCMSASTEVAIGKARAAVMFKKETKVMEDAVNQGRPAMLSAPGQVLMEGGIPIVFKGAVVGAVGVSGVRKDQDAEVAKAAVAALTEAATVGDAPAY